MTPCGSAGSTQRRSCTCRRSPCGFLGWARGGNLAFAYAAAPDGGTIYVGAGPRVAVVDTAAGQVERWIRVPSGQVRALTVSPDGGHLFIAVEHRVFTAEPATGEITGQTAVSATRDTVAVAVSPDERSLYAATVADGYVEADVRAIDRATGAVTVSHPVGNGVANNQEGFSATDRGVVVRAGTGMLDQIELVRPGDSGPDVSLGYGGGGVVPTLTVTPGVAWLGGLQLGCADPSTGVLRDAARLPRRGGSPTAIGDLADADGRTFAIYDGGDRHHRLVELTPPTACTP